MQESERIPELGNRTWEELEVVPHPEDGALLFRDRLRKRNAKGGFDEVPVRVCVVRPLKIAQARVECRKWFTELGLDEDKDKDTFRELEQFCILARAVRDEKSPHAQLYTPEELATSFDEGSCWDILGRIEAIRRMTDPRQSRMSESEVWSKTYSVARAGNLFPLTDIAGHEQPSCIVFMARQAMSSPMGCAWLRSQGISTPEPSASQIFNGSFVAAG